MSIGRNKGCILCAFLYATKAHIFFNDGLFLSQELNTLDIQNKVLPKK